MNFAQAVNNREARTTNGMKARATTANNCVDLFYNIGASRGKDITTNFVAALAENKDYAVRIAQWARDVRGGAGERKLFRDILKYLAQNNPELLTEELLLNVPEIGRWDDLWSIYGLNDKLDARIISYVSNNLTVEGASGLVAKWLPRQKEIINGKDFTKALREKLRLSPKEYRKFVVAKTNVVEQKMCAKKFDDINFQHVPSLAHARYKKAFLKNSKAYVEYVEALKSGEAKINASAVYPYDVLKTAINGSIPTGSEADVIKAQWDSLPNYLGDQKILSMVDTSASMTWFNVGGTLNGFHIALSLGLYTADKLTGAFKDLILAFTTDAQVYQLKGDIIQKLVQARQMNVGGSTNLHAAFQRVLDIAVKGNVPQEDMPDTIIIFSDMQFNSCTRYDDSAMQMVQRKYAEAGYEVPKLVFWNLNSSGNVPVKFDQKGVALVSGFSPAIMQALLGGADFTPEGIMLEAIMKDRYNWS